jgi:eukaryotic-like serine/threonine-protein kinase
VSSSRYERAKEIFLDVCDLGADERSSVLDEACAGDIELRRDVEELLGFHSGGSGAGSANPAGPLLGTDDDVPGYRVVQRIGEGGMGEVYEAEQLEPVRRRVALKVVKWGMDSKEVLARFESERQAMALMNHHGIATVLDAGTTRLGRPYFAMEYVDGVPVTDYCDRHRLSTAERLRLFMEVCSAVQHAHQRGVIHRDLKPSNILVAGEGDQAVPKIIDFGIAKATSQRLTERTLFTQLGQWIGTPEYMSPEQAEMTHLDVDTRSDVYSLGVVLYELLSGAAPFDPIALRAATFDEMRRTIREHEPPRPSTRVSTLGDKSEVAARRRRTDPVSLVRELRGDLDWIVMKALEKDRARRYGSASELAADLERHLADEPVLASPPRASYRVRKFVRRHRVGVAAAAVVVATLVAGVVGTAVGLVRARREAQSSARLVRLLSGLFVSMDPTASAGQVQSIGDVLAESEARIDRELAAEPLVVARLKSLIGQVRLGLGQPDRARALFEEAYRIRTELLPDDDRAVAEVLNQLGLAALSTGKFSEAFDLDRRALAIYEAADGPDSSSAGHVLGNLCVIEWRLGRYENALASCERSRELLVRAYEEESIPVAAVLFNTSLVLRDLGRIRDALDASELSLAIREKLFGPSHSMVGWSLWSVGFIRRLLGDLGGARDALDRAIAIQSSAIGPDSYEVAMCLQPLAAIRAAEGDLKGASETFKRSLEMLERARGVDWPDLPWVLRQYGGVRRRLGDLAGAQALIERAIAVAKQALGEDHPEVAYSIAAMGFLEYSQGRLEQARTHYERSLEVLVHTLPPRSRWLGATRFNLACLDALQGRRDEALAQLRAALDTDWTPRDIANDHDLASLRGDPEFEEMQAEALRRLDR